LPAHSTGARHHNHSGGRLNQAPMPSPCSAQRVRRPILFACSRRPRRAVLRPGRVSASCLSGREALAPGLAWAGSLHRRFSQPCRPDDHRIRPCRCFQWGDRGHRRSRPL